MWLFLRNMRTEYMKNSFTAKIQKTTERYKKMRSKGAYTLYFDAKKTNIKGNPVKAKELYIEAFTRCPKICRYVFSVSL